MSITIEGFANTTDKDRQGDIITPQAWVKGLDNFRNNSILLFQHDGGKPVGEITKMEVSDRGLFVEAEVSDTEEQLQAKILEGQPKAFSVGFQLKDIAFDEDSDTFFITDLELLEISIVSVPANPFALFEVVE